MASCASLNLAGLASLGWPLVAGWRVRDTANGFGCHLGNQFFFVFQGTLPLMPCSGASADFQGNVGVNRDLIVFNWCDVIISYLDLIVVISAPTFSFSTPVSGLAFLACLGLFWLGYGLASCLGGELVVLTVWKWSTARAVWCQFTFKTLNATSQDGSSLEFVAARNGMECNIQDARGKVLCMGICFFMATYFFVLRNEGQWNKTVYVQTPNSEFQMSYSNLNVFWNAVTYSLHMTRSKNIGFNF